jgi:hypothetical protein
MRQLQAGDLVRFSDDGFWIAEMAGKLGLVTEVWPDPRGLSYLGVQFNLLVDGSLLKNFRYPTMTDVEGVILEVISGEVNGEG